MSHHDKALYPEYNTPEIRAELVMLGLEIEKPSMAADCFRFGFIAARKNKTKADIKSDLEDYIAADFSNASQAAQILVEIAKEPKEASKVCYEVRVQSEIILHRSASLRDAQEYAETFRKVEASMQAKYGSEVWPSRAVTVHKCEEVVE